MEIDVADEPTSSQRQTRSASTPRAPPSSDIDPAYSMKCVVCGNKSNKMVYEKTRISEDDRATLFLDAAKFNHDAVYTGIAALNTIERLIAADIYVHMNCIRAYERELEESDLKRESEKSSRKQILFNRAVPSIDLLLQEGKCCTLSC